MRKNCVGGRKCVRFVVFPITLYLVLFGSLAYAYPIIYSQSLSSHGNCINIVTGKNYLENSNFSSIAYLGDIEITIWEIGVVEVVIEVPDDIYVKWHDIGNDRVQGLVQINYSIISYLDEPFLPCNIIIGSLISLKHRDTCPYVMKEIRPIHTVCVQKNFTITNDVIIVCKDDQFDIEAVVYAFPEQLWRGLLYGSFSRNQKTVTITIVRDDGINNGLICPHLGRSTPNIVYVGDCEVTLSLDYQEESNTWGTINLTINNVTKMWQMDSSGNISGFVGLNWSIYSVKDFQIPWIIWIEIKVTDKFTGELVGAILYGSSHKYNASSNNGTLYAPVFMSPQGRDDIDLVTTLRIYSTPQTLRYKRGLSLKKVLFLPLITSGILTSGLFMMLSGISVQVGMSIALGALYVTLLSIGSLGIVINGVEKESVSLSILVT
jgi:hypothetical protein